MKRKRKKDLYRVAAAIASFWLLLLPMEKAWAAGQPADMAKKTQEDTSRLYQEYRERLDGIETREDIEENGFRIIENQIFPILLEQFGEVLLVPAMDKEYDRLTLFWIKEDGQVVYRTDQLEANWRNLGQLKQPCQGISAVSFQDVNGDGRMDVVLIVSCLNDSGDYAGKSYKVGDVLFQNEEGTGFYRDYRISDKVNRFGMNKSVEFITAFVRDGYSTEFLYTSTTLAELQRNGLQVIEEMCYFRDFEKLGRLQVVPGTYSISDYDVFMVYLVNEQGYIVSALQPMGDFDNLYALKGINCRDIDGDGMKDIIILARYSYEGSGHELIVESDYAIYYQRTRGFSADTDIHDRYPCGEEDTMEEVVAKARAYWGWNVSDDQNTDSGR